LQDELTIFRGSLKASTRHLLLLQFVTLIDDAGAFQQATGAISRTRDVIHISLQTFQVTARRTTAEASRHRRIKGRNASAQIISRPHPATKHARRRRIEFLFEILQVDFVVENALSLSQRKWFYILRRECFTENHQQIDEVELSRDKLGKNVEACDFVACMNVNFGSAVEEKAKRAFLIVFEELSDVFVLRPGKESCRI
jgi:hypothetical protein